MRGRRVAAAALAALGLLLLPGAVMAHWATTQLVETERLVAALGPLADDPAVQDRIEERMRAMLEGIATSFEVECALDYDRYYPATINDAEAAADVLEVAATVGTAELAPEPAPTSEDFSFMLQQRPGAYIWLGQATHDHAAPLHNPHYDFNDNVLETGVKLHVALARHWLR